MKKVIVFFVPIAICLITGYITGLYTADSIEGWYYRRLQKPSFNPPDWLFAPVWTVLYIMMGISAALLINKKTKLSLRNISLLIFILQLGLNAWWSVLFFINRRMDWAFYEITVLWLAILCYIIISYRISKNASYLMVPYLLWVSFAAFLNFTIWKLNT